MILVGDALTQLKTLPDASVHCCVTSPPYYGLRDYGTGKWEGGDSECDHIQRMMTEPKNKTSTLKNDGRRFETTGHCDSEYHASKMHYRDVCGKCGAKRIDQQIGLEETPEAYVAKLVEVFREVRRVLRGDGTLWVNLGDSYGASTQSNRNGKGKSTLRGGNVNEHEPYNAGTAKTTRRSSGTSKQLLGIPWRVAFALQADGWILRQDIIWHKPNPMPESVQDRCTKSHEYIFLFAKQQRYYFDQEAIKVPLKDSSVARLIQNIEQQQGSARVPGKTNGPMKAVRFGGNKQCPDTRLQSGKVWNPKQAGGGSGVTGHSGYFKDGKPICGSMANKRSVWTIATRGYKGAHFAVFPPALVEPCIKAGCPAGGTVLDPFGGSGTTGQVAKRLGRDAILIELNPNYIPLIEARLAI